MCTHMLMTADGPPPCWCGRPRADHATRRHDYDPMRPQRLPANEHNGGWHNEVQAARVRDRA